MNNCKLFPRAEERAAFFSRAIKIAQGSLSQAWALRRLRDRYVPQASLFAETF